MVMAGGFIHHHQYNHLLSIQSPSYNIYCYNHSYCFPNSTVPPFKSFTTAKIINSNSAKFRTIPKSSSKKNPSTIPHSPPEKPISLGADNGVKTRDLDNDSGTTVLLHRLRKEFKLDGLGMEILSIALPAALALAADPITSLVSTGFVGHLGSAELAAVGVSASVFNLVSKLFNVPLLNITTSFVAEEQALVTKDADECDQTAQDNQAGHQSNILLPSVSTSLALAAGLGIIEAVALSTGSSFLMNMMGIHVDSPMHMPAEQFLKLRAFGAPPIVIALAAQGTFRGFKDTKTPLFAVGAGNLLNAILDPILIFFLNLGVGGAAFSTVISEYDSDVLTPQLDHTQYNTQTIAAGFSSSHMFLFLLFVRYLIALILLWKLSDKVLFISPSINGGRIIQYLQSGALLTGRTLAALATTTLATSMAAREGPVPMAGHQICFQVWLALSLLNDALALAGQTLLASDYSQGNYGQASKVAYKVLQIGMVMGVALAVILFSSFDALSSLFSTDSGVLKIARSGTWFVAGSQPMNAIAFVLDGLYYGVSDFGFAAYSMLLIGLISSVFLLVISPLFGLAGVWSGLFLFMTLRVVAGAFWLSTRSGPWNLLQSDVEKDDT